MKKLIFFLLALQCTSILFAQSTGDVFISAGTILKTNGKLPIVFNDMNLINNGTLQQASGEGTVIFSGVNNTSLSGNSTITFDTLKIIKLYNSTGNYSSGVTLSDSLNIAAGGSLIVSNGNLSSADLLTLKSDQTGTASIGNSSGTITGKVTIERYIPARLAWRLMSAPITPVDAPTINASWQEGSYTTPNSSAVNGTFITGGASSAGFDQSSNNKTNLKFYDGAHFMPVTSTLAPITDRPGYFLYVFFNRSGNIATLNSTNPATVTTLRVKGNVYQGSQSINVNSTGYTLIGNPYAATVDFNNVLAHSTNVNSSFYLWNPQIGGTYGAGAYVLVTGNGTDYTYVPSNPTGATGVIQQGQCIVVQSADGINSGAFKVNETDKSGLNNNVPFGRVKGSNDATIAIDLQLVNADTSLSVVDGILMRYNSENNNAITAADAFKFGNVNENFYITSTGKSLMMESREMPLLNDTIKLNFSTNKSNKYLFDIAPGNFEQTGMQPILMDNYLKSATPLNLVQHTAYPFTTNTDVLSKATDRFSIVFKEVILPFSFINLTGTLFNENSVSLQWKVLNQGTIASYQILSADETGNYTTLVTVPANLISGSTGYKFTDLLMTAENMSYKIKAIGKDGTSTYSDVVKLQLPVTKQAIRLWPNPLTGNIITLKLNSLPKGMYNYKVFTAAGEIVYTGVIDHSFSQIMTTIHLPKVFSAGSYRFIIEGNGIYYKTNFLINSK